MRRVLLLTAAVMSMFASALQAATYVVPEDRELVAAAPRIVTGTVIDTYSRRSATGSIETVTEVAIEETLKGDGVERTISMVHAGGHLGDEWMIESGAPVFARGERVLLFLDRNANHDWTTWGLALGAFREEHDDDGNNIFARAAEVFGFTEDGREHVERPRREGAFLDFVRAQVRGTDCVSDYTIAEPIVSTHSNRVASNDVFAGSNYSIHFGASPARRKNSSLAVAWQVSGTQSGVDVDGAVTFGNGKWNAQSALIDYSLSNTPASGDSSGPDSESRIIANDPHDVVTGTCCSGVVATAFSFCNGPGCSTFTFNNESFTPITHSDIVINNGVNGTNISAGGFKVAMTHELGHTLALRHSNVDANEGPCAEPLDCCVNNAAGGNCKAIMNSVVINSLSALGDWDKRAIDCLYDGECASFGVCTPASITTQPANKSIVAGESTSLSVTAGGSGPFTYQWFIGNSGDTSQSASGSSATLNVSPTITTSYWVRVTGQCGDPVDSNAATVTVNPCPDVTVGVPTSSKNANGSYTLNVSASSGTQQLSYEWFRGDTPGSGGTQVSTSKSFTVTISATTSFWVRVTNRCGNSAVSSLVTIALCNLPVIATQPADQSVQSGGSATLSVGVSGVVTGVTWYQGSVGNKLIAVGNGGTVNVGPLTQTTQYWAAITNACGEIATRQVTITVTSCDVPQIVTEPADQTIPIGGSATLTIATSGTVTGIFWYQGIVGDTTTEVGSGASVEVHPLVSPAFYWAAVTNTCGVTSSRQVTITTEAPPCTPPSIVENPAPQSIKQGETATLSVVAAGTPDLHYEWYRIDGDALSRVGEDSPEYTTEPLFANTRYIVEVVNGCGGTNSDEVTVTVGKGRRRAARH